MTPDSFPTEMHPAVVTDYPSITRRLFHYGANHILPSGENFLPGIPLGISSFWGSLPVCLRSCIGLKGTTPTFG